MKIKALLVVLAAALFVAGCGGAASHNDADLAFVTGMIPHHTQAVEMSALAADRAASSQVRALAAQISGAQEPEIAQMQGLLEDWGRPPASTAMSGSMSGPMSGMMTNGQMQQLAASSGAAFDRLFLQEMTAHHDGAVDMAGTEIRDGASADAKALAQKIIDAQRAEIATMGGLLAG